VLRQLGVAELRRAIVGIGTDIEASVLTVLALSDLGVNEIWAKAITAKHGKILSAVGADHVIYPEAAMGERVAHLIASKMLDFIEFDDGYAIAKVQAPTEAVGKTLSESQLRTRYGITVVGVKMTGSDFTYARPDPVLVSFGVLVDRGFSSAPCRQRIDTCTWLVWSLAGSPAPPPYTRQPVPGNQICRYQITYCTPSALALWTKNDARRSP
jgi:trk system potassium uptake protein TrkA